jgi:hypothetical protein
MSFSFYLLKNISLQAKKMFDAIEGFKQFLVATEKDRLNMLNPSEDPGAFRKIFALCPCPRCRAKVGRAVFRCACGCFGHG